MPSPLGPLVRPRVVLPDTGDTLPLDNVVAEWLEGNGPRTLELVGGIGAGKSTALDWLVERFPARFNAVDDSIRHYVHSWTVCATHTASGSEWAVSYRLSGWGLDDWLEYLLAAHPTRVNEVVSVLRGVDRREIHLLEGRPALWRAVLDELAANPALRSVRQALITALARLAQPLETWRAAEGLDWPFLLLPGTFANVPPDLRLLRQPLIQAIYQAQAVVNELRSRGFCIHLMRPVSDLPPRLLSEIAVQAAATPECHAALRNLADGATHDAQPLGATIVHAAGIAWRPPDQNSLTARLNLRGAKLAKVDWQGANVMGGDFVGADLSGANLREANLENVEATGVVLRRACLAQASLSSGNFIEANLAHADLSGVTAEGHLTMFIEANLTGANLQGAHLWRANFMDANLRKAVLRGADLRVAGLLGANLRKADLTGACLDSAILRRVDLRTTVLDDVSFRDACLKRANLAGQMLRGVLLEGANLSDADLTGTYYPGGRLRGASLCGAHLAEIEWEGADLSNADLRGASFHLGSSRSGLVNSPLACEGSKTGFYTDDYCDQGFQPIEQIRKANLCGADLRGADITGVDFYLVDLRRARYTDDQKRILERTRAILYDRVPTE